MPELWDDTIEAHRHRVRLAITAAAARLAARRGPLDVTMSQIAEEAGISRATLYKYFAGVEEVLRAWHERQVEHHLELLTEVAERDQPAMGRLTAALGTFARIQRQRTDHAAAPNGRELAALLHRVGDLASAEGRLHTLVVGLLEQAAQDGDVRDDIATHELASYCLHALSAAGGARSQAAGQRLVGLVLDGLTPRRA